MIRIYISYISYRLGIKTVAPTLPGLQGLKVLIQYLASNPPKTIFYPYNYFDRSNFIIITWSGTQVEEFTTHNCLECHQVLN